jgi:hypothetical protein
MAASVARCSVSVAGGKLTINSRELAAKVFDENV